jgi:hypothetical protein
MKPRVPHTCQECRDWARLTNIEDVMLDAPLHEFIVLKTVPKDPIRELKVRRAAAYFTIDQMGQVWAAGPNHMWLRVPQMKDRRSLVEDIH